MLNSSWRGIRCRVDSRHLYNNQRLLPLVSPASCRERHTILLVNKTRLALCLAGGGTRFFKRLIGVLDICCSQSPSFLEGRLVATCRRITRVLRIAGLIVLEPGYFEQPLALGRSLDDRKGPHTIDRTPNSPVRVRCTLGTCRNHTAT